MDFYEILQQIMDEQGLNIPAVARACGLSDGTIRSMFTRKQKNVALEVAFKLSSGLGVSLERLNGLPEKSNKKTTPPYSSEAMQLANDYDNNMGDWGRKTVRKVADIEMDRHKEEISHRTSTSLIQGFDGDEEDYAEMARAQRVLEKKREA